MLQLVEQLLSITFKYFNNFFFQFIDGLFYWRFKADQLPLLRFDSGGRQDRGKFEIKQYCYIPIRELQKLSFRT